MAVRHALFFTNKRPILVFYKKERVNVRRIATMEISLENVRLDLKGVDNRWKT